MTTEHRENRSLPIRTAVEPASLLPLSAHMSYGQMRMALYNVAPDLQVSPRAQSFAHFGLHPGGADVFLDGQAASPRLLRYCTGLIQSSDFLILVSL